MAYKMIIHINLSTIQLGLKKKKKNQNHEYNKRYFDNSSSRAEK